MNSAEKLLEMGKSLAYAHLMIDTYELLASSFEKLGIKHDMKEVIIKLTDEITSAIESLD